MKTLKKLHRFREEIDKIDKMILSLLSERFVISKKIQKMKKSNQMALIQKKRERQILWKLLSAAKKKKLPIIFIKKVYRIIFTFSRK